MTDLIKRDDAPDQIFASQGADGWRWPRASKFPEQGPHENIRYVRADLVDPAADRIQDVMEERDTARRLLAAATQMQIETQAKLTKAVEALRWYDNGFISTKGREVLA